MVNKSLFSSESCEWETPQDFFDIWNRNLGSFHLDVCATPENAKCPEYFTKEQDGLAQKWFGKCWMNPPYGRSIGLWVKKALGEVRDCNALSVTALLPSRTDTKWWHEYILNEASEIVFIKGRLKFGNSKNSAPFPSVIVHWSNHGRY